tara:strand:- start:211 stop:1287 length:1077 start_codon:yes stop_codon:yes gene_type:complete
MVKIDSNMLERAGLIAGVAKAPVTSKSFEKAYDKAKGKDLDFFKIGKAIKEKEEKSNELLNKFPQGISIPKVPEGMRPELTKWLIEKKQDFSDAAAIIANGRQADPIAYDTAVETQNGIEASYLEMSNSLEAVATARKNAADRQRDGNNAKSMTNDENINFHNLYQENFGADGLNVQITNDKLMFTNASGNQVEANDLGSFTGTAYDYATENTMNALTSSIENLAVSKNPYWNKDKTRRDLEAVARNPQAIKNYVYQNPELIDQYISNQVGVPIEYDDGGLPIGDWEDIVNSGDYDKLYDSNKVSEDFSKRFVETAMSALENVYNDTQANYKQYIQTQQTTGEEGEQLNFGNTSSKPQ